MKLSLKLVRALLAALLLLVWGAAGVQAQTLLAHDSFTDTAHTNLTAHTGESGVWTALVGSIQTDANGRTEGLGTGDNNYINAYVPSISDYDVAVDLYTPDGNLGVRSAILSHEGNAGANFYAADMLSGTVSLYKVSNGNFSLLGSFSETLASGGTATLRLNYRTSGSSANLSVLWNGTTIITATDSSPFTTGAAGIRYYGNETDTTGIHIDNYSVYGASSAATAFTLTGPASGAVSTASTSFTATPNGTLGQAETVALTSSVAGDVLTPSSLSFALNATAGQTFTLTPNATVGARTITATPSPALGTAPTASYTATTTPITIGVSSAAAFHSPGNWAGDTGRGGSVSRKSWNNGAYGSYTWSTAAASPTAKLLLSNATGGSISYFLDGAETDAVAVPTSGGITISGVTTGSHILRFFLRQSPQSARWVNAGTAANVFVDAGLTVDGASTPGTAPAFNKWIMEIGDSITEGIQAANGADDNLADYSFLAGQGFMVAGYDYCVSACGYSGWLKTGDSGGDVPAYYFVSGSTAGAGGTYADASSRWNKVDGLNSLLDTNSHLSAYGGTGQEPAAIFLNYGVNEDLNGLSISDTQASVQQALVALRAAAPLAQIIVSVPFGLYNTAVYGSGPSYVTAIKSGVAAYQAAVPSDTRTTLLDLGTTVSNVLASTVYGAAVHPNIRGHAYLAPLVVQSVLNRLTPASTPLTLFITGTGSTRTLNWTTDPLATSYKVYRGLTPDTLAAIATVAAGTLTYVDTARPAGNVYYSIISLH